LPSLFISLKKSESPLLRKSIESVEKVIIEKINLGPFEYEMPDQGVGPLVADGLLETAPFGAIWIKVSGQWLLPQK
jgi:hypothetical protein